MAVLLANNAVSTLASSIGTGATTIAVASGHGSRFPSPSGDDWFPLTMVKNTGELEIVRCTARSADVLTITRAQEGTPALAFDAGDIVQLRLTAAAFAEGVQQDAFSDFFKTLFDEVDAAAMRSSLELKTAAITDKQVSVSDATAGRLLMVGAFGLGGLPAQSADANAILRTGFSYMASGASGLPIVDFGYLLTQMADNNTGGSQVFIPLSSDRVFFRRRLSSAWSAWRELYHTGNFAPSSYVAKGEAVPASLNPTFCSNASPSMAGGSSNTGELTVSNSGNGAATAAMTFIRDGAFAVHFGLDVDNKLKVGGWSIGAAAYEITHSGNLQPMIAGVGVGSISSYAFMRNISGSTANPGETRAGSALRYADNDEVMSPVVPDGSWICCGSGVNGNCTVWKRIN